MADASVYNAASELIEPNIRAGRSDKVAFIDRERRLTYGERARETARLANLLCRLGVRREERVALALLDTVDFPIVFLGAIKAGIVPIPLNTLLTSEDYRFYVEDSRAAAVFVSGELAQHWTSIARDFPGLRFVSSGGGPWTALESLLSEASPHPEGVETCRGEG